VDPLTAVAVAVWCFLVALVGGLVGLVLGNIRLPVILLAASSPAGGAGANIGISGVAASAASVAHIRAGRVNWRLFAVMAPPSVVGAIAGGVVSGALPGDALLAIVAVTLLYFGVDLLRRPPQLTPAGARATGSAGLDLRAAALAGALIGFIGGVVGLILGSLRMPALVRYVGERPSLAVGTNVTVGVVVGAAGVVGHAPSGVDWELLGVGAAASIPGAMLGARLTGRLSEPDLLRAVGVVLVVAGFVTGVQAIA
jgi:uncharacterized membrane protein YfcA